MGYSVLQSCSTVCYTVFSENSFRFRETVRWQHRLSVAKQMFQGFAAKYSALTTDSLMAMGDKLPGLTVGYECQAAADTLVAAVQRLASRLPLEKDLDSPGSPWRPKDVAQADGAEPEWFNRYQKMTMRRIAESMNISPSTVYRRKKDGHLFGGDLVVRHYLLPGAIFVRQ